MVNDAGFYVSGSGFIFYIAENGAPAHEGIRFAVELADYSSAAEIVHRGIPLVPLEMFRTVAPVLRKDICLRVFLTDASAYFGPEFLIKLDFVVPCKNIRNVEAPAINGIGRSEPFFQDGILCAVDGVPEGIGSIVEDGHCFDAEPAEIGIFFAEEIITALRGIGIIICADGFFKPCAVAVEPFVVGAGVVDGDIEDYFHSVFVEGGAEFFKRFVAAEMGIDVEIIEAVVFMDGRRGENRIEIEGVYTEFFEIGDFFGYALEVAAIEIEAMGVGIIFRNAVPVGNFYRREAVLGIFAGFNVVFRVSVTEALRENLIKNGIPDPFRLFIVREEDKIRAVVRNMGGNSPLGIVINLVFAGQGKLIGHAVFGYFQLCFVPDEAALGFNGSHFGEIFGSVGIGDEHDVFYGSIFIKANPDFYGFGKVWVRIAEERFRSVAVDAYEPVFHSAPSFF